MRDEAGPAGSGSPPEVAFPCVSELELRNLAWQKCGLVRSGEGLREAVEVLRSIRANPQPHAHVSAYELRNIHAVAELIARCALAREESRGGHYRSDFPSKSLEFEKHSLISRAAPEPGFA
jgi:L-aspartate oxidase